MRNVVFTRESSGAPVGFLPTSIRHFCPTYATQERSPAGCTIYFGALDEQARIRVREPFWEVSNLINQALNDGDPLQRPWTPCAHHVFDADGQPVRKEGDQS